MSSRHFMINRNNVSAMIQSLLLIVVSSTVPAFGVVGLWLISTNLDAIYTNLWGKVVYLITVLVGVWFLNQDKTKTHIKLKIQSYKSEWARAIFFILLSCCVFGTFSKETLFRVLILIATYTIVGISEEILYRGYILTNLSKAGLNFWIANLLQALLFAFLGHYGLSLTDNLLYRLPFGLIFGLLSMRSKSVIFLGELHATYDLIMWFYF